MYLVAVVIMYCLCLQALVVVNSHGSLTVSNIRRFWWSFVVTVAMALYDILVVSPTCWEHQLRNVNHWSV